MAPPVIVTSGFRRSSCVRTLCSMRSRVADRLAMPSFTWGWWVHWPL